MVIDNELRGTNVESRWVDRAHWLLTQASRSDEAREIRTEPTRTLLTWQWAALFGTELLGHAEATIPLREALAALGRIWHAETDGYSLFEQKRRHRAYQSILSYGERAIRFMLDDLRDNSGFWYVALHEITGEEPPIPDGYPTNFDGEREAWLRWGRAHGYEV